jgi:hypothetical protein
VLGENVGARDDSMNTGIAARSTLFILAAVAVAVTSFGQVDEKEQKAAPDTKTVSGGT